jgi:hypothetical protein
MDIIAVCLERDLKPTHTVCGKSIKLLIFKICGWPTYN